MRLSRLLPLVFLLAVVAVVVFPGHTEAKEEKLLILTTSDTRSEITPCG